LDLGIHLTTAGKVTNSRVWFQLKGIHANTLPREEFDRAEQIAYSIQIEHLRAWYQAPEVVYLVLYVESANLFLAEDVRHIVHRSWGEEILNTEMFSLGQVNTTVNVLKSAQVDGAFWTRLRGHRSMRADGRMFRGRPLGHDLDPLRTTLNVMDPTLFEALVRDLLSEHRYRREEEMDVERLFPGASAENIASLECGVLHEKFEIVLQSTTEMLPDGVDGYRHEGASDFAHGPCALLIHSRVAARPNPQELQTLAAELIRNRRITRLLAFVNAPSHGGEISYPGLYAQAFRESQLRCQPQHLQDISFNFLTTTNTYHRFRGEVSYFGEKLWSVTKPVKLGVSEPESLRA
jgi:hypothetical protein